MKRPIRIGLIAEGEAELGRSIPYVKPEEGGKPIERAKEGALHRLIRRQLGEYGLVDCEFVQRHPGSQEILKGKLRSGHGILDKKFLAQTILVWLPHEIDIVILVVDADESLTRRNQAMEKALQTIQENHLDINEQPMFDRSVGGIAIKNFDTWLLADVASLSQLLGVSLPDDLPSNLETLPGTKNAERGAKNLLDDAISRSEFLEDVKPGYRELLIRWELGQLVNLVALRKRCPKGYGSFADSLEQVSHRAFSTFHE